MAKTVAEKIASAAEMWRMLAVKANLNVKVESVLEDVVAGTTRVRITPLGEHGQGALTIIIRQSLRGDGRISRHYMETRPWGMGYSKRPRKAVVTIRKPAALQLLETLALQSTTV